LTRQDRVAIASDVGHNVPDHSRTIPGERFRADITGGDGIENQNLQAQLILTDQSVRAYEWQTD
jgi:hypothetical protein